nr:hypothetical protein OG546_26180 [Streptomyces antimycoticus]
MMLRRYHNTEPDDPAPDGEQPTDTAPDGTDDAPQADKPAGRSRSRSKPKEG